MLACVCALRNLKKVALKPLTSAARSSPEFVFGNYKCSVAVRGLGQGRDRVKSFAEICPSWGLQTHVRQQRPMQRSAACVLVCFVLCAFSLVIVSGTKNYTKITQNKNRQSRAEQS